MTVTKITLKAIDERVGTIRTMGREFNSYIHETAMMVFRHAAPTAVSEDCQGSGDCTRALKIVRAMPASMRRTMLIEWFRVYTPIRIKLSDNGDKCEFDPKYKKLTPTEKPSWWKIEEAAETAFYDIAEQTPEDARILDLPALIEMARRLGKTIAKRVDEGKVLPEDTANAKLLAAQLETFTFKAPKPPANSNKEETVKETGELAEAA